MKEVIVIGSAGVWSKGSSERAATRRDVPAAAAELLRWHDKTGGNSQMASHSRARQ